VRKANAFSKNSASRISPSTSVVKRVFAIFTATWRMITTVSLSGAFKIVSVKKPEINVGIFSFARQKNNEFLNIKKLIVHF
jgi:hypothetical protein